jgi:S1-C subfamily serine protease
VIRLRLAAAPSFAALSLAGALLLSGCTGGGSASTSSSPPSSSSPSSTAAAAGHGGTSSSEALSLQQDYVKVVDEVRPSVVQITTSSGLGSGIVYDRKGDIVTNDHVVYGAKTVTVQLPTRSQPVKGRVVSAFPGDDLAVVRVSGVNPSALHPAKFADSSKLQVGDIVLAIGNPLGLSGSVTSGIVSAVGRTVPEPAKPPSPKGVITNAIQTSAPINPGNSGGALVILNGDVVGIPTLAAVDPQIGGAASGIGFAIPANTVTDIANQIIKYGHVVNSHRAELGILAQQVLNPLTGQPAGVLVAHLAHPSPAGRAGIRPGDVITAINGHAVRTTSDLETILAQLKPGQRVNVSFVKPDGAKATVSVKLGTLPGNTS